MERMPKDNLAFIESKLICICFKTAFEKGHLLCIFWMGIQVQHETPTNSVALILGPHCRTYLSGRGDNLFVTAFLLILQRLPGQRDRWPTRVRGSCSDQLFAVMNFPMVPLHNITQGVAFEIEAIVIWLYHLLTKHTHGALEPSHKMDFWQVHAHSNALPSTLKRPTAKYPNQNVQTNQCH